MITQDRVHVPGINPEPFTFSWDRLPTITAHTGTGGTIRNEPEHFLVEELPAYEPSGTGSHFYFLIEKRNLTTADVVRELVQRGISERDIGVAGLKDKHAVTVQWMSVPKSAQTIASDLANVAGITILDASYHRNKLATGHLRGNRFTIRIQGTRVAALQTARETLATLAANGVPNYFGPQRFGSFGRNAYDGLAVVRGIPVPGGARMERFFVSALQSLVFNEVLAARVNDNVFTSVIHGDWAKKHDTGGQFEVLNPSAEQHRVVHGEISATIPLHGTKVPVSRFAAGKREQTVFHQLGLTARDFTNRNGDRRLSRIFIENTHATLAESDLIVGFDLPKGSFATTIIREITKEPIDAPAREDDSLAAENHAT